MARRFYERGKSAQSSPVSGRERAASRTMVPPILLTQNRHPHRRWRGRWRGRFAVLDPTRSLPGAAFCFSGSGGQDDTCTAYRRAKGRTRMERRSGRNPTDQSRTGGCPGRAGSTRRLRAAGELCRAKPLRLFHDRKGMVAGGAGRRKGGKGLRQDKRNGAMASGHHAISSCLHILFSAFRYGAIFGGMALWLPQPIASSRYFMAPGQVWRLSDGAVDRHG